MKVIDKMLIYFLNLVKSTEEAKDCAELAVILAIFGVSVDTSQVLLNENYEGIQILLKFSLERIFYKNFS